MTKACVNAFGTSTSNVAFVSFFWLHCSFAILEPSGKGLPSPGMPDYIFGALRLYLNFVNLFQFLMMFLGQRR